MAPGAWHEVSVQPLSSRVSQGVEMEAEPGIRGIGGARSLGSDPAREVTTDKLLQTCVSSLYAWYG